CAAELLQSLCCVHRFAVDVDARSELLCERSVFGPTTDSRNLVTEFVRELNAQMTKSADTLDSDEVAGGCTAVAQRVEHSDAGAEQWRRLGITQTFRYRHNSLHRSHHILLVSPVVADARNFQVLAVAKISSLARSAGPIVSAMPTHTDTLSLLPVRH